MPFTAVTVSELKPDQATHELTSTLKSYVAICAIVKDQGEDILEWALYHKMIGIDTIYIHDHNSTIPLINEVLPLVKSGTVEYTYFKDPPSDSKLNPQIYTYVQCLNKYSTKHRFIAFIDIDEFIVLNHGEGNQYLPDFLRSFENHGALGINWRVMGSDNHTTRPSGGALENYQSCYPEKQENLQKHIKSIVNTKYKATPTNPHYFKTEGVNTIDYNGQIITGPFNEPPALQDIILHHYFYKSEEDFYNKHVRGTGARKRKSLDWFDHAKEATESCPWGVELARRLRIYAENMSIYTTGIIERI